MGQVLHVEPPVGGLNARDAVDGLQNNEAIRLINWVPDVGYLRSRRGHVQLAGLGTKAPIETLISFESNVGDILLAVSAGRIFNASDAANIAKLPLPGLLEATRNVNRNERSENVSQLNISVLTTSRLQYTTFTGQDGLQRCILTGSTPSRDGNLNRIKPLVYLPETDELKDLVVNGEYSESTEANPAPLNALDLFNPVNFKGRVIYGDKNRLSIWYSQAGSFQGELTEFPLGGVFQEGGDIQHVFTWSKDTGDGMDDMLGIMSTTGETLIYQGDDPDDALGWEMIQRYGLPKPLDAQMERMGAEMMYMSEDGYVNLSQAIAKGPMPDYAMLSGKIARLIKESVQRYRNNFGWQLIFYPRGNMLMANIPVQENRQHRQHVMNTRTGAWTTFEGQNSCSLTVTQGALLFGSEDGLIYLADRGTSDSGKRIECTCVTAYNPMGNPQRMKQATAYTVISNHLFPQAFNLDAVADFEVIKLPPMRYVDEPSIGQWNVSFWDEDYWGSEEIADGGVPWRRPVNRTGFNLGFAVRQASRSQTVYWFSSSIEFKVSGRK